MRAVLVLIAAVGCDDHLFPAAPSGPPPTGDGWCGVRSLFGAECLVCHSAAGAPNAGGLDLETDPHAALVGVVSPAYGELLVDPGNPDGSVLVAKLEGTTFGPVMPPTGALPAASTAIVRDWVAAGADDVCATTTTPTPAPYHPTGWTDRGVHGLAAKFQEDDCQSCHGEALDGGAVGVSCTGCHAELVTDWTTTCTFCHGDPAEGSGAPPEDIDDNADPDTISFPAHLAHVDDTDLHVGWGCATCHDEPVDVFSPGHLFVDDGTPGVAEVGFAGGVSAGGAYASPTCTVYCHSDARGTEFPIAVTAGDVVCGACHPVATHWADLSGHHREHLESDDAGPIRCNDCHSTAAAPTADEPWAIDGTHLAQHLDGAVEVDPTEVTWNGTAACAGTCHGHTHAPDETWP